jgi:predicted membrane channel-forming protein YqfA (hemolysin III family)
VSDDDGTRLDRELNELLQELRVTLPGVQVLFAFLLTVPFSQRFAQLTTTQRTGYFVAFLTTTAASALLLAPAAYHRVQWRRHDKERLLRTATRLALAGLVLLGGAIATAAFVVTDILYETAWASVVAASIAAGLAAFWFVLPLSSRLRPSPPSPTAPGRYES